MTADDATRRAAKMIRQQIINQAEWYEESGPYITFDGALNPERIAEALSDAGLLAPAPLTEERSIVIPNGRGFEFSHLTDFEKFAKEHGGEERTRWVTAWEPVHRAEGDGRADG